METTLFKVEVMNPSVSEKKRLPQSSFAIDEGMSIAVSASAAGEQPYLLLLLLFYSLV